MRTIRRLGWAATARTVAIGVVATVLVLAAWSPAGAHNNGTLSHLWDHFKGMKDPGTINDPTNPVHWTKLQGVPASIADGLDNIGSAGFGLELTRGNTFFVNTSEIQRRLKSSCDKGQAIKAVSNAGDVTCTTGPLGLTKRIADTGEICNGFCTEGSLALTPGTWAITAKITLDQTESDVPIFVVCELHAAGLKDEAVFDVDRDGATESVTVPLQLMATYTESANTSINCRDLDVGSVFGSNLSIIAIRLAT